MKNVKLFNVTGMSRVCEICKKDYNKASIINKLRGNYNRAGKKKQRANLQSKIIDGKKVSICVKCIRTLSKQKKQ